MSRKGITYYVSADTHFGHSKLIEMGVREKGHEEKMLKNHYNLMKRDTPMVFLHLGDFCIGQDGYWHDEFMDQLNFSTKCILLKGNHDRKTNTWYSQHGWDFVGEIIILNAFGLRIMFSHKPQADLYGCDFNVHGHLHNPVHVESNKIVTDKHILVSMERNNYSPVSLRKIVRR